jgi:hypothetical protein
MAHEELEFKDGTTFVGEIKDNKKDGYGTQTSPNGTTLTGEWKDDIFVKGTGTFIIDGGGSYVGEMNEGLNGQGTLTAPNGMIIAGEFTDGRLNGHGTMIFPNEEIIRTGEFTNSFLDGPGTLTYPDGSKKSVEFKDGKVVNRKLIKIVRGIVIGWLFCSFIIISSVYLMDI